MEKETKKEDKGGLAIAGGVMIGVGVGFFLLRISPHWFVGSILLGLGLGLMISAFIRSK